MKAIVIWLFLVFNLTTLFGQNQDNNWYFGGIHNTPNDSGAGLSFNTIVAGLPSALTDSGMGFTNNSASISDENGQLLFYTNGVKAYNRQHQQMPNGFDLGGDLRSQFGSLIVPNPGNFNQYYIFSSTQMFVGPHDASKGTYYSKVDMTLDNCNGDVVPTEKKVQIMSNSFDLLQGAYHANGTDYWVINIKYPIGNAQEFKIYAFHVSAAGVAPPVITSLFGMDGIDTYYRASWFKMSPDNHKAVLWVNTNGISKNFLLNFDNATGVFTYNSTFSVAISLNNVFYNLNHQVRSGGFSPDGSLYYAQAITANSSLIIAQYQVNGLNGNSVAEIISNSTGQIAVPQDFRVGPDGKLYITGQLTYNPTPVISTIQSPNTVGTGCNFVFNNVSLAGKTPRLSLPNTFLRPLSIPTIAITSNTLNATICNGQSITFTANVTNFVNPPTLQWQVNGIDVAGATGTSFTSTTLSNGDMVTCVSTTNCWTKVSNAMTVLVTNALTPTLNPIAPICPGSILSALPTTSTNGITGTWSPALNNQTTTTYTFTPDAGQCATNAQMTILVNNANILPTFTPVAPICTGGNLLPLPTTSTNGITGSWSPGLNNQATTTYTFTPDAGQCATNAQMTIIVNNANVLPTFTSVAPICSGGNLLPLPTTSNNGITGTWSPGLNNQTTTTYTFTPNSAQCASVTQLTIVINDIVTPGTIVVSEMFSENATLTAIVNGDYSGLLFQLDNGPFQSSNVFTGVSQGWHTIHVVDSNFAGCNDFVMSASVIGYPHYFTPNSDGIHDTWNIWSFNNTVNKNAKIRIYDRFSKLLKEITPSSMGWDGTYKGQLVPSTDYWFSVQYSENGMEKEFKSHFAMKR